MAAELRKALIPAAGLGTRLLSATKEQPKEMLPLFSNGDDNVLGLKPLVQRIFEQLFDFGIREFYFVVGKGKRAIEDHFTPDHEFIHRMNSRQQNSQAHDLEHFYRRIEASTIVWVNQPNPKGFGDAVLLARNLMGNGQFLVHAGDTCIISKQRSILTRLKEAHTTTGGVATLTLQEVEDPRRYGVAQVRERKGDIVTVERVVEKPTRPRSKLAIMPLYIFNPSIFDALHATSPGKDGELQLTDAIQRLIDDGYRVQAIKLRDNDVRLDIGTPETYWEALELSHRYALEKK
jgi:UTP--glucose-1-phosphate uridylyltransferase